MNRHIDEGFGDTNPGKRVETQEIVDVGAANMVGADAVGVGNAEAAAKCSILGADGGLGCWKIGVENVGNGTGRSEVGGQGCIDDAEESGRETRVKGRRGEKR